jgi:hypothetical protein
MPPRKLRPGQSLSATDTNDLVRRVEQMDRVTGTGFTTAVRDNGGMVIRDNRPETIWARISGAPTGSKYPFVEVVRNVAGTGWDDIPAPTGRFGTATDTPAVELGGRTDVAVNAIVELNPLPGGGGWGFTAGGGAGTWSTTASGILTTTSQTGGGQKASVDGTGGSRGGWITTSTPIAGDTTLGSGGWYPYFATFGTSAQFAVHMRDWAAGAVPAPVNTPMVATSISANTLSAAVPKLTFVSAASTSLAISPAIIAAGDPGLPTQNMGFGVFRGTALARGIDHNFAAGDRPIVRGGIVVGYINSGGTVFGDNV